MAPDARPLEAAAPTAAPLAPAPPAVAAVPRPMPLRPLTAADVLDGSIAVLKAAPRTVLAIAAAVVVPLELLASWLQRDTLSDNGISGVVSAASSTTSPVADVTVTTLVLFAMSGVVLAIVAGAIAHLCSGWYADRDVDAREALGASIRRLPALVVAWVFVHVFEAIGLVGLAIGSLLVMPLFVVVAPAIVVEHLGPWQGIRRSMRLTKTRYAAVLGIAVLVGVVDGLLTIALSGVGLLFEFFEWGWIVNAVTSAGSALVTVPFVAAAATLVYFDLRVRSEGLDIELGIASHFGGAR
jgi:hypothetical protein